MKSAKETEERINKSLATMETLLGKELDDQEKLTLLQNSVPNLHLKMKEQFQFPNASDQFNLESMGKVEEYGMARKVMSNIFAAFQSHDFEIKEGIVNLSPRGKEAIIEKNTHRTENDAQTEALELAEKLVKDLNKAREKEWIDRYNVNQVKKAINIINKAGGKFVPHYSNISLIRFDLFW